jgi:hypothetical protein
MALQSTTTEHLFPYGTFPVDPALSACYTQHYSRAHRYPLPNQLPSHHPQFSHLVGVYPLQYSLPPWWHTYITHAKSDLFKPLLSSVSAQEFRAGCFDQARWKAFRETLSDEERRRLPQSPKLVQVLEGTGWSGRFGNRGPADTPDDCRLVISTQPLDFLYMSNGREWHSCQHLWNGGENQHLPGNFYDTGVAVAMVLPPDKHVEDDASVLARTTLRVFRHKERPVVAIGRTYHNNETVAFLLLCRLAEIFDAHHLTWGLMIEVNTLDYCEEGLLGPALAQRLDKDVLVAGEPCWFPHNWWVPYVDGGDHQWEPDWQRKHDDYYCLRLLATIRLMRP